MGQRELLDANREAIDAILARYAATNPRLFGSVARGDAQPDSDIDLLVDLDDAGGNAFLRLAGLGEELTQLLGVSVDVVAEELLRAEVSATARRDLLAL
jgi:predicted nucleotidyltransferase